ncbi:hypothetical protein TNCV_3215491 [Trichonephila clavipes]|nr:hypothetical protein TNCV_3215491 [Trichonephila clavipes]
MAADQSAGNGNKRNEIHLKGRRYNIPSSIFVVDHTIESVSVCVATSRIAEDMVDVLIVHYAANVGTFLSRKRLHFLTHPITVMVRSSNHPRCDYFFDPAKCLNSKRPSIPNLIGTSNSENINHRIIEELTKMWDTC